VVLGGDNQVLIQALKGEAHTPWKIQTLIADIKIYLIAIKSKFLIFFDKETVQLIG